MRVLPLTAVGIAVGLVVAVARGLAPVAEQGWLGQGMTGLVALELRPHANLWVPLCGGIGLLAGAIVALLRRGRPRPRGAVLGAAAVVAAAGLAWWAVLNLGAPAPAPASGSRPNVVLVFMDTLRADGLSAYGNPRPTSPTIDGLADAGVLFERVYAQSPATFPSVHATMTSRYASEFFFAEKSRLENRFLTLAEVFRNAGYATHGISSSPIVVNSETQVALGGFQQGFDVFDDSVFEGLGEPWNWQYRSPEGVVEKALAWLDSRPDGAFFLLLYIMDPHDAYRPPPPYADHYDPGYSGERAVELGLPSAYEEALHAGEPVGLSPRDIEHFRALYDEEIRYADAQLARVLERLDAEGLARDTLVVLTSDHGEEFYEHGGLKHGYTLYEEQIRVPLVMRWPAGLPAGRRIDDELVQSIDLMPTLVDLAGLPEPPGLRGRSTRPLIEGTATAWREYAVSEAPFVDAKAIVSRGLKYIHFYGTELETAALTERYRGGVRELYDLRDDPGETRDLYVEGMPEADALHETILQTVPDVERARVEYAEGIELDDEAVEKLRSLGYLQ